jgi:hypothetical protein
VQDTHVWIGKTEALEGWEIGSAAREAAVAPGCTWALVWHHVRRPSRVRPPGPIRNRKP